MPKHLYADTAAAESRPGTPGRMGDNVIPFRSIEDMILRELYLLMMMEFMGMTFGRSWRGYY